MASAQDMVTRAFRRLQAIDINEQPSASEMSHGLAVLDELISGWSAQGIPSHTITVTGDLTDDSDVVRGVLPDTAEIVRGLNIAGSGVDVSVRVKEVLGPHSFRMSAPATASGGATSLTMSVLPLDVKLEGAVIALLAVRLSEDLGVTVTPKLQMDADRGWADMLASLLPDTPAQLDSALLDMPSQGYARTGTTDFGFNG